MGYDWSKQREFRLPDGDEDQVVQSGSSVDQQAQAESQQQAEQAQAEARQTGEEAKRQPGELPDLQYKPLTPRQQRRKERLETKKEQNGTLNPRQGGRLKNLQLQDKYNKMREAEAVRQSDNDDGGEESRKLSEALDKEASQAAPESDTQYEPLTKRQQRRKERLEEKEKNGNLNERQRKKLEDLRAQDEYNDAEALDDAVTREISEKLKSGAFKPQEQLDAEALDDEVTRDIKEKLKNGVFKPQEQPTEEEETTDDEQPTDGGDNEQSDPEDNSTPAAEQPTADSKGQRQPQRQTTSRDMPQLAVDAIQDPTIQSAAGRRGERHSLSEYDNDKYGIAERARHFDETPILDAFKRNNPIPEAPTNDAAKERRLRWIQFFNLLGGLFNTAYDVHTASNRGVVFNKDYTTRNGIVEQFIDKNKAIHAKALEDYNEQMKLYRKGLFDAIVKDEQNRLKAFEQIVKASATKTSDGFSESVSLDKFNYTAGNARQKQIAKYNPSWYRTINVMDGNYNILKADYNSLLDLATTSLLNTKEGRQMALDWFRNTYPNDADIPAEYKDLSHLTAAVDWDPNQKTRFEQFIKDHKTGFGGMLVQYIESGINPEVTRNAELYIFGDNKGRFAYQAQDRPFVMQAISKYYSDHCQPGSDYPIINGQTMDISLQEIRQRLGGMTETQLNELYFDVLDNAGNESNKYELATIIEGNGAPQNGTAHPSYHTQNISFDNGEILALYNFDTSEFSQTELDELKKQCEDNYRQNQHAFEFKIDDNDYGRVYLRHNKNTITEEPAQENSTATGPQEITDSIAPLPPEVVANIPSDSIAALMEILK